MFHIAFLRCIVSPQVLTILNNANERKERNTTTTFLSSQVTSFIVVCCENARSPQSHLTLRPYRLQATRLFCPWDSPGKNTGVGCHALLQGTILAQRLNPHLLGVLYWQVDSLPLAAPGKPLNVVA